MAYRPFVTKAVKVIHQGGIIAYPTEAVFGFGCHPAFEPAVLRLLRVKQRPVSKGLILVAADTDQLKPWIGPLSDREWARVNATWPGPVTWTVPKRETTPEWLTGEHDTLAVRVSAHPIVQALCRGAGVPLVSTSANTSQQPPCKTRLATQLRFGLDVDLIVPGHVGPQEKPTEIRSLTDQRVIRSG